MSYGLALEEVLASGESVPNDIARDLPGHVPPVAAMAKELARARLHGMVTGFMLRWSVSRWNAGLMEEASKARAANVVHEWLQKSPERRPAKSSAVESWFDEYRSVAHMWAAWQILDDAGINAATPEGFRSLAATSSWLLAEGAKIVSLRSTSSLLSIETAWRLPDDLAVPPALWSDDLDYHDIRKHGHPKARPTDRSKI